MTTASDVDARYDRFLALFNRGEFWASHEALEDAWRERRSEFYHGLILLASAFVHVARGNRHGIAAQLAKAATSLQDFAPHYLGLDVARVLALATESRQIVAENPEAPAEAWRVLIPFPRLAFEPALVRGDEAELRPLVTESDRGDGF